MARKKLVSQCWALDVRQLNREGKLIPDCRLEWVWRDQARNQKATLSILVRESCLELNYMFGPERGKTWIHERIPLVWVRHGHHGQRICFACPVCQRRCAILYAPDNRFRCRHCARVGYPSQYPRRIRSYGWYHRWTATP